MRIYFKETNGNNIIFATDGITVKAFYRSFNNLDLYIGDPAEQFRKIFTELIKEGMLLPFDEIESEDEWDEPFLDDLIADCELVIDTEEFKHENCEH